MYLYVSGAAPARLGTGSLWSVSPNVISLCEHGRVEQGRERKS